MFKTWYDLKYAVTSLDDFFDVQHFLFGCVSYLRRHLEWPKVEDAYKKCKLSVGYKSSFAKTPGWQDFSVFSVEERKKPQFGLYHLLADLQEYNELGKLRRIQNISWKTIWHHISSTDIEGIWHDTVVKGLNLDLYYTWYTLYPIEVRRMAYEIRTNETYSEIGVLGDLCEDVGLLPEAEHFHNPKFVHTFACRCLHRLYKGMDGR